MKTVTTGALKEVYFSDLTKAQREELLDLLEKELKEAINKEIVNGRPSHIRV